MRMHTLFTLQPKLSAVPKLNMEPASITARTPIPLNSMNAMSAIARAPDPPTGEFP